jgi:hypothetical protein
LPAYFILYKLHSHISTWQAIFNTLQAFLNCLYLARPLYFASFSGFSLSGQHFLILQALLACLLNVASPYLQCKHCWFFFSIWSVLFSFYFAQASLASKWQLFFACKLCWHVFIWPSYFIRKLPWLVSICPAHFNTLQASLACLYMTCLFTLQCSLACL